MDSRGGKTTAAEVPEAQCIRKSTCISGGGGSSKPPDINATPAIPRMVAVATETCGLETTVPGRRSLEIPRTTSIPPTESLKDLERKYEDMQMQLRSSEEAVISIFDRESAIVRSEIDIARKWAEGAHTDVMTIVLAVNTLAASVGKDHPRLYLGPCGRILNRSSSESTRTGAQAMPAASRGGAQLGRRGRGGGREAPNQGRHSRNWNAVSDMRTKKSPTPKGTCNVNEGSDMIEDDSAAEDGTDFGIAKGE